MKTEEKNLPKKEKKHKRKQTSLLQGESDTADHRISPEKEKRKKKITRAECVVVEEDSWDGGDEKEARKRKKKEVVEVVSDSLSDIRPSDVVDENEKAARKKKRKKNGTAESQVETEQGSEKDKEKKGTVKNTDTEMEPGHVETGTTVTQKKKKKKKKEAKSTENAVIVEKQDERDVEEVKRTKKKKKEAKTECEDEDKVEPFEIKSKKGKKKKQADESAVSTVVVEEEEEERAKAAEVSVEEESTKKRKKKTTKLMEEGLLSPECDEEPQSRNTSKKSKRKKRSAHLEAQMEDVCPETKKEKKEDPQHGVLTSQKIETKEAVRQESRPALRTEKKASQLQQPDKPSGFGQWSTAQFQSSDQQQKFLRLMGGFKKGFQPAAVTTGRENMALGKDAQQHLQQGLLGEFERAHSRRLDFNNRGAGLGFAAPSNKKFSIDINASRSVRFDD